MKYSVLVVILLGLGCTKKEVGSEPAPAGANSVASDSSQSDTVMPTDAVQVQVLERGEPPLRQIRWQFREGSEEILELKNISVMKAKSTDFDGTKRTGTPQVPPGMLQQIAITTEGVSDDGTAAVGFRVVEDTLLDTSNPTPGVSITPAKGARGTYSVGPSGVIHDFTLVLPPELDPAQAERVEYLENLLQLTVLPVPKEPVGVGGRWSVTRAIERRGSSMDERIVIELVDRTESGVVVAWKLGSMSNTEDTMRTGSKSSEYKWDAEGRTTFVLSKVLPIRSDFDNVAHLHSEFVRPDDSTQVLDVVVERQVEMRSP
jgi:hypothetical protein